MSKPSSNFLRVGEDAVVDEVRIPIAPPQEFDGKTRAEVERIRREAVALHPELTIWSYDPYAPCFGQIVDRKPWWGLDGLLFYTRGTHAPDGPSERSSMVVNPFLLIDTWAPPILADDEPTRAMFRRAKATDPGFLYAPPRRNLTWEPRASRAAHVEGLSEFLAFLARHEEPPSRESLWVEFRALNARDWGFTHVYLDVDHSKNLLQKNHVRAPMQIGNFIHLGPSCGHPELCNNLSPRQPQLEDVRVWPPARAHFLLWRQAPAHVEEPPDFVYDVLFE